jgi:hypothetical protein
MNWTWKATLLWLGVVAVGYAQAQHSSVVPQTDLIASSSTEGQTRGVLPANPFESATRLFDTDGPVGIYGWLNGGYIGNANNPVSKFNGPYNAVDRDELMFNQAYLVIEKLLGNTEGIEYGFRADALYGFDYILAQSRGLEVNPDGSARWNGNQYYGLALPQLYGEVGNKNASLKVGRFYSVVGYTAALGDFPIK